MTSPLLLLLAAPAWAGFVARPVAGAVAPAPQAFCYLLDRAFTPGNGLAPFAMPASASLLRGYARLDFALEEDRRIVEALAVHLRPRFAQDVEEALARPERRAELAPALFAELERARGLAANDLFPAMREETARIVAEAGAMEVSELWSAFRQLEKYAFLGRALEGKVAGIRRMAHAARDDMSMTVARAIARELESAARAEQPPPAVAEPAGGEFPDIAYMSLVGDDPELAGYFRYQEALDPRESAAGAFELDRLAGIIYYEKLARWPGFPPGRRVTLPLTALAAYHAVAAGSHGRSVHVTSDWLEVYGSVRLPSGGREWRRFMSASLNPERRVDEQGRLLVWSDFPEFPAAMLRYGFLAAPVAYRTDGQVRYALGPTLGLSAKNP